MIDILKTEELAQFLSEELPGGVPPKAIIKALIKYDKRRKR
jgi:hypothetical protein